MSAGKVPDKANVELRRRVDAVFALAQKHGINVKIDIRWPDGLRVRSRTLNARELAARANRATTVAEPEPP